MYRRRADALVRFDKPRALAHRCVERYRFNIFGTRIKLNLNGTCRIRRAAAYLGAELRMYRRRADALVRFDKPRARAHRRVERHGLNIFGTRIKLNLNGTCRIRRAAAYLGAEL